jgi:serine/threonine protein kinase
MVRDDPEQLLATNVVAWHKRTSKRRVAEIQLYSRLATPNGTAFFKCIEHQSTWRRWLGRFRDSPVRKGWEVGHALLRRLIDTPRPILFVEVAAPVSHKYYLLTEAIPESTNLTDFLNARWTELPIAERQTWLDRHRDRLASQVRRLHDGGFDHRDLKFANLLVSKNISDPRIWFIDLDGIRTWKRLPEERAVQNLARICVSAQAHELASLSNRLRFLNQYLGDRSAHDWKWWWRKIGLASERKLATNKRRGRAVQ